MKSLAIFFAVITLTCFSCGVTYGFTQKAQEPADQRRKAAADEIYRGACAYKAGDYAEAQRRFEKALAINPEDKHLTLYLARSLHAQATNRTASVNNVEKAQAAIAAYELVLAKDADNSEAINAILRLYEQMNRDEQAREWLQKRAASQSLSARQQADMFVLLANQYQTSYSKITRDGEDKLSKPAAASEMNKARQYVLQGLEAVEKAFRKDPDNADAWLSKYDLLKARAEIAQLDAKREEQEQFSREAAEFKAKHLRSSKDILNEALKSASNPDSSDSAADQQDKQVEILADILEFHKSGVIKRSIDPDWLIDRVEQTAGPFDGEEERKKAEEERNAKRMAKLPWKLISPAGKNFSVLLPSPAEKEGSGKDDLQYRVSSEGIDYFLNWHALDKSKLITQDKELVISSLALGAARGLPSFGKYNREVVFVKDLTLAGGVGRQYSITFTDCSEVISGVLQVFIEQEAAYLFLVIGAGEADPRVSRFLQSFTLRNAAKPR